MTKQGIVCLALGALFLSGCGSSEQPPVEQIVVREPGSPAAAAQPPADIVSAGKAGFAACSACHTAGTGEASASGPDLYAVLGRRAASLDDFAYSDALTQSNITWDEAQLDAFLADPAGTVPGTSMAAGAVSDAERRAAIIAYLASLAD